MDLHAEMKAGRKTIQRFRLEVILEELDDGERDSVLAALADTSVFTSRIAEVLTGHGYPVSANAVGNFRRKCATQ